MKGFVFTGLLMFSAWTHAEDWQLLTSDDASRALLDVASVERTGTGEVRFQIKRIYTSQKDMMGLQYNAARSRYAAACPSGLVLYRQQFLLQDDEVVWTFPESDKVQKASLELPEAIWRAVCPADPAGAR